MKTFEVATPYSHISDGVFRISKYANNDHIAISIWSETEGPFADLTVNLPDTKKFPANCSFVDTNNFPMAETLISQLRIGRRLPVTASSGFCVYPLYAFNETAIKQYMEE